MDTSLRSKMIRLAATMPVGEDRKALLEILRQASPPRLQTQGELRDPYYSLADGYIALKSAVRHFPDDRKLSRLVADVGGAFDKVRDHLNKFYIWD